VQKHPKLYLACADGHLVRRGSAVAGTGQAAPAARAAERAAYEAVWKQAEADMTELRADVARCRAEQAS